MASQYISVDDLSVDEEVALVIAKEPTRIEFYYKDLDRSIEKWCWKEGVPSGDIPVDDTTGFVESPVLECAGVYYFLYKVCHGFNRIGKGEGDDAYNKWEEYKKMWEDEMEDLNEDTILGGPATEPIDPTDVMTMVQIEI